jgi:hypothetical protein
LARTSDRLNMRRSATLLACQRGRERRRRIDVLRAEQAHVSATAAEASAREHWDAQVALSTSGLTESHEAVRNRIIDLQELSVLTAAERSLQQEVRAAELVLVEAEEDRRKAGQILVDAMSLLGMEVRLTRRRERLAGEMRDAWEQATEAVSEAEIEDQVADSWNAV